jgi:glycine betaine/proline transport system substrate-binding protein
MRQPRRLLSIFAAALAMLLMTATGNAQADEGKPTIRLGYVSGWSSNVASIHVVASVIKNKLHYPVKLIALDAGPMWQGVAQGDLDATVSAWLPTTHAPYYERLWSEVINLGPNLLGTRIGLVVPDYVTINSIDDLNASASKFRAQIVGIGPGAGIMIKTQDAIKEYGLRFNLIQSSGPAMTAQLARAIKYHHWVVVTGWTPHWMWAKWKLKYLDDPKGVYGHGGHINTVVSRSLPGTARPVYEFLRHFQWTADQMGEVMLMIRNGAEPEVAAEKWVQSHPEEVARWVTCGP